MKELEDLRLLVRASAYELDAAARHGLKTGYLNEGEAQATLKLAADLASAFRALDARMKADPPAPTETVPVCDYWPNGPAPCGRPATHHSRNGERLFCSYHAIAGSDVAMAAPQGAPCNCGATDAGSTRGYHLLSCPRA